MSSAVSGASLSERVRYRLYGLAFVAVVVMLVLLMLAQYNQAFKPVFRVTVRSDRAGLQLVPHSDVKVRGLIVGEVRAIHATSYGRRDRPRARSEQGDADPGQLLGPDAAQDGVRREVRRPRTARPGSAART